MAKDRTEPDLDRELADLAPELRWREWMRRIEAVLFASASPVPREDLARVVGQGVSVDLLVEDLLVDLEGRSFEVARVSGGWMLRSCPAYAPAIRVAADVGEQDLDLREFDVAVLAAIAYNQPVTRDGLKNIFGKGYQPRPDRPTARAGPHRHGTAQPAPRCTLYLRDNRAVLGRVRAGELARPAGSGAAGGRRAGMRSEGRDLNAMFWTELPVGAKLCTTIARQSV